MMDFNSRQFDDRLPVPIRFANAIGDILTAARQEDIPPLRFFATSEALTSRVREHRRYSPRLTARSFLSRRRRSSRSRNTRMNPGGRNP